VLRPATKIGMRLPTARGGETRSLSRALAVLGAPTQWRSVFGSVKDTKGPSLPYARACAVVPRLPEPSSGDASLYVVCMLRGMAFAGDFHVHPQRYFFYNKKVFFFFYNYRSQNNTLGRGAPAALRPPWRPSVPVPTRRLFYAFLTYLSRLRNIKSAPSNWFSPTVSARVLRAPRPRCRHGLQRQQRQLRI